MSIETIGEVGPEKRTEQTSSGGVCEVHVYFGETSQILRIPIGVRLMQAIKGAGLPIEGACGGVCTCATCHVYIEDGFLSRLPAPKANEAALLQVADEPTPLSRLSCQIEIDRHMNGMKVRIAPA